VHRAGVAIKFKADCSWELASFRTPALSPAGGGISRVLRSVSVRPHARSLTRL